MVYKFTKSGEKVLEIANELATIDKELITSNSVLNALSK